MKILLNLVCMGIGWGKGCSLQTCCAHYLINWIDWRIQHGNGTFCPPSACRPFVHTSPCYSIFTSTPYTLGAIYRISLQTHMFLGCGKKPEYSEKTQAVTGRTCKLHTTALEVRIKLGSLVLWGNSSISCASVPASTPLPSHHILPNENLFSTRLFNLTSTHKALRECTPVFHYPWGEINYSLFQF